MFSAAREARISYRGSVRIQVLVLLRAELHDERPETDRGADGDRLPELAPKTRLLTACRQSKNSLLACSVELVRFKHLVRHIQEKEIPT